MLEVKGNLLEAEADGGLHELYAYGSYENYHIDYSAIETPHIERIK